MNPPGSTFRDPLLRGDYVCLHLTLCKPAGEELTAAELGKFYGK